MAKETALPLSFLARMAVLLDEEFPQFLAAINRPPLLGLRVNTLKLAPSDFEARSPWPLRPVPWCPDGFFLPPHSNAGLYPYHDAGLYYIQEPSTMAVATLLTPRPGERILDLCGSPGGKATHLAAMLAGQGLLVANEIDRRRAEVLRRSLERWGASRALVLNETPERLAERWPGAFDRVLVDAPCSGEGMFRKHEHARYHWSEAHVAGCALRQADILDAAARLVRPGGLLGYATCTFSPEENEGTIWRFLQRHPQFRLQELPQLPGFQAGRAEWALWPQLPEDSSQPPSPSANASLAATIRLWPHKIEGEGHFIALLHRAGDEPPAAWQSPAQASQQAAEPIKRFWDPLIGVPRPERLLLRPRDRQIADVYAPPDDAPDTSHLRAISPGWHLGTLRKGRFEPAHALALALTAAEVSHRLDEPVGSEFIGRYLHGEALRLPGPDGWLLVTVDGFPLGWAKRSRGVVKNHYPRGLRWLKPASA